EVQFQLAMTWDEYGELLLDDRRSAEAEQYLRKALAMLAALPTSENGELLWALGHVHLRLGDALAILNREPEAEDALKQARKFYQQLTPKRSAGDPLFPRQRAAVALFKLAMVKLAVKDFKDAEDYLRRARDEMEPLLKAKVHVAQFQVLSSDIEQELAYLL